MRCCKALGADADEVDVGALVEHKPGSLDGVRQMLHTGDAARAQVFSIHQQRIQLHTAIAGQVGAATSVEGLVIFHYDDCGLDRLHRSPATFQDRVACIECVGDASLMRLNLVIGHRPGSTMNQQHRRSLHHTFQIGPG